MDSRFFFENTIYWSEGDERAHFEWLDRISIIRSVRGKGTRVYLDINTSAILADDIRELEAVYRRYGGDLSQLGHLRVSDASGE